MVGSRCQQQCHTALMLAEAEIHVCFYVGNLFINQLLIRLDVVLDEPL